MSNLIEISNKTGKVKLTDAVTPWSVEKLTEDIGKLFGASASEHGQDFTAIINAGGEAVDTLEIEINSPGGSIFDGYNIYREIKSLQERGVVVTATITGMAASMASVIAMAADKIQMVQHGRMMIHEASQGVRGNAEELRKAADLLDGISNDIAVIYSERTSKPLDDVRAMMKKETWMTAAVAKELGFIDSIITHNKAGISNTFDIRRDDPTKTDMKLIDRLTSPSSEEATAQIAALENQIGAHDAEIQGFKDKLEIAETALQEAAGFKSEVEAYSAEVIALKAERDALAAELTEAKAASVTVEETAAVIATEVLASIGQPEPLAEGEVVAPVNHKEVFAKLTGQERTDYYNKYSSEIRA